MKNEKSDRKLGEQIRRGNRSAFKKLYDRYHKQLYFFAKRYLKDRAMVEDAVQEVFIKLWKKKDTLDASSMKGFLFTMLKNHVLNMIRDRKTRRRILEGYKGIAQTTQRNSTVENLIFEEYKGLVEEALEDLSPAKHEVFEMKNFEGLTNSRIAEIREVSVNTVKSQFYLGTQFIREYLKKYGDF